MLTWSQHGLRRKIPLHPKKHFPQRKPVLKKRCQHGFHHSAFKQHIEWNGRAKGTIQWLYSTWPEGFLSSTQFLRSSGVTWRRLGNLHTTIFRLSKLSDFRGNFPTQEDVFPIIPTAREHTFSLDHDEQTNIAIPGAKQWAWLQTQRKINKVLYVSIYTMKLQLVSNCNSATLTTLNG